MPAKAGIQLLSAMPWEESWIPAFAGMTNQVSVA
jgi:hypothetical protein